MERAVALKKLGKILGKSFRYRVDPKAPDQDEREEARAKLKELVPQREALSKATDDRRRAILQADAEYQRLRNEYNEKRKECDALFSRTTHYRFTVGVMTSLFFMVKAQGDSWEEVIKKLTKPESVA